MRLTFCTGPALEAWLTHAGVAGEICRRQTRPSFTTWKMITHVTDWREKKTPYEQAVSSHHEPRGA